MRIAEIRKSVFCEISPAERSEKYTLDFFHIPQKSNRIK